MAKTIYSEMRKFLPKAIDDHVDRTSIARRGKGIYKRGNNRARRVLVKYDFWKNKKDNGELYFFNSFEEGYVILINPEEYFGNDNKELNPNLDEDIELSKNSFVYYRTKEQYEKFKPLKEWTEVYEVKWKGKKENDDSWFGDYVIAVDNGEIDRPSSFIVGKKDKTDEERKQIKNVLKNHGYDLEKPLSQCGLGNYDFDYANNNTINNVKYQILYFILTAKSKNGLNFVEFIKYLYQKDKITIVKDDGEFLKECVKKNDFNKFSIGFKDKFKSFEEKCKKEKLLNYNELKKYNIVNSKNEIICPLCCKPIYLEDFFEGVEQDAGREIMDNTQRAIELMHIDPLRSGELNHKPDNLGWGHKDCNIIQGNKSIPDTIKKLEEIVEMYKNNTN